MMILLQLSSSCRSFVRKKTALCLLRLYRKNPDVVNVDGWSDWITQLLDELDFGVLTPSMSLLVALVLNNHEAYWGCLPKCVKALEKLARNQDVLREYSYAIPDVDEDMNKVLYEAESPDEAAFVITARGVDFEFFKITQTSVSVNELDPMSGKRFERPYTLFNVLEFNSTRRQMSVIVRDEGEKLLLPSKGAERLVCVQLT